MLFAGLLFLLLLLFPGTRNLTFLLCIRNVTSFLYRTVKFHLFAGLFIDEKNLFILLIFSFSFSPIFAISNRVWNNSLLSLDLRHIAASLPESGLHS